MIHPTYLPFTRDQLLPHFTGDAIKNVAYFERSVAKLESYLADPESRASIVSARRPRQLEKDERFWTVAALKSVFESAERVRILGRLLSGAFGEKPPIVDLSSWSEALDGTLHLFFEAQLPSPIRYKDWLRENLQARHLVPYVRDAAAASRRGLEGATHADAVILNSTNGFALVLEAKVLSDISKDVSFDMFRNQIARSLDVLLDTQKSLGPPLSLRRPDRTLFALLTPGVFREQPHSRLYGWLIPEYQRSPEAILRDLPHRGEQEVADLPERIGWLTFEDVEQAMPGACPWIDSPRPLSP